MVSTCTKVVPVLLLVALLGSSLTAGGCDRGPGPEDVVHEALAAMDNMVPEKMAVYFTEDTRKELIQSVGAFFDAIDELEIDNINTVVVSQTEDTATVEGEWDIDVTRSEVTESDHMVQTVELVKVEGAWLISNLSLLE